MTSRVVVTGIGAITPLGTTAEGLWCGVRRGMSAVRPITRFDATPFRSRVAAEIEDFDPNDHMDSRRARRLDLFSQLAIAASRQAIEDAQFRLRQDDGEGIGVYIGSALGGVAFGEEQHVRFLSEGIHAVEPSLALAVFGGAAATNVAMEFGLRGPALGNANSCASGLIAIGEAFRLVRSGAVDAALAGGVEAPLAPLTFGAFSRIRALSARNDDPQHASRPFDRGRDGFVMGEGAAMLLLEPLESAVARGACPYGEILGYGLTNDAYHMVTPLPTGRQGARAMGLAMADARLQPCDVGYVNAHATSTPLGDAAEALSISLAFGEHRPAVSGTKGLHGHALGASGAIEAAITLLALQREWLPPTANLEEADTGCGLAFVARDGEARRVDVALTNSFGFGGINASVALARCVET